jgi:hypothetical protein
MSLHLLIREAKQKSHFLKRFLMACNISISPVHKAAGIDRPTALYGRSFVSFSVGKLLGWL